MEKGKELVDSIHHPVHAIIGRGSDSDYSGLADLRTWGNDLSYALEIEHCIAALYTERTPSYHQKHMANPLHSNRKRHGRHLECRH